MEYDPPKLTEPVGFSFTKTSTITESLRFPSRAETSTVSKKPRERMRSVACLIRLAEKGSPSAARNCLRMTLSKVAVLPAILILSRITLGPRSIEYVTLSAKEEPSLVILGLTLIKSRPFFKARRSIFSTSISVTLAEYIEPVFNFKIL